MRARAETGALTAYPGDGPPRGDGAPGVLLEIDGLHVELPVGEELRPVIHEATLSLAVGEALGLVGESGAGKSMTARAILRLLPEGAKVNGAVRFDGADVLAFDKGALRRFRASDAAMIFQDPTTHINPVRKIGDFLTEALEIGRAHV